MARLYANENFALPAVEELRGLGHDVVSIAETGKANQRTTDDDVLTFAHADARAVLTFNRKHFFRLHRERLGHSGIIACTFDPEFAALAERIHLALAALSVIAGELVRINRPSR